MELYFIFYDNCDLYFPFSNEFKSLSLFAFGKYYLNYPQHYHHNQM